MRATARLGALQRRLVELPAVAAAWGGLVDLVERQTAPWVGELAAVAGGVAAGTEGAIRLAWADEPRRPWIGCGWVEPLAPLLRPRLEALAADLGASAEQARLVGLLLEPAAPKRPAMPATTADARRAFREASAALKLAEAELFDGQHVARQAVVEALASAQAAFRSIWWSWAARGDDVAGKADVARSVAAALHAEAVAALRHALDGLADAPAAAAVETAVEAGEQKRVRAKQRKAGGRR